MEATTFNPRKALQLTRIIYYSILTGILFFLIIVIKIISNPVLKFDFSNPVILTLFILTCTALPFGFFASKKYFNRIDLNASFGNKYSVYQTGLLIRLAACDGIALLSVACLLVTGNLFCILFFIVAVAVFIAYYPTPDKIGNDIQLTETEIEQFTPGSY